MTTPEVPAPAGFEAFGLRAEVLTALKSLGYEEPTPIQRETIPALLSGRERVSVAEYERLMGLREALDQKPLAPAAEGATPRFLGVEQHKRVYSRPSA